MKTIDAKSPDRYVAPALCYQITQHRPDRRCGLKTGTTKTESVEKSVHLGTGRDHRITIRHFSLSAGPEADNMGMLQMRKQRNCPLHHR